MDEDSPKLRNFKIAAPWFIGFPPGVLAEQLCPHSSGWAPHLSEIALEHDPSAVLNRHLTLRERSQGSRLANGGERTDAMALHQLVVR